MGLCIEVGLVGDCGGSKPPHYDVSIKFAQTLLLGIKIHSSIPLRQPAAATSPVGRGLQGLHVVVLLVGDADSSPRGEAFGLGILSVCA